MSVINRRNAVLGYATLKVLERRRKQSKRNAPKIALYLALGLVSAGVLAGLVAVLRRRRSESEPAAVDTDVGSQGESEIVGEQVAASPEPLPAA